MDEVVAAVEDDPRYKRSNQKPRFMNSADTMLLAYAKAHEKTLVTYETPETRTRATKIRVKIPDVA